MSEKNDAFLFSFSYGGKLKEGIEKSAAIAILKSKLDCSDGTLEKLFSGGEVVFKTGLDFMSVVDLIKIFREAGAEYSVKIYDSVHWDKIMVKEKGQKSSPGEKMEFELDIELKKAEIEFDNIREKIGYIDKLSNELDRISMEKKGKFGKKYIALNVRSNELWSERSRKISELIKNDRNKLEGRIRKLNKSLNRVKNSEKFSRMKNNILDRIREGNNLIESINNRAERSGIQPDTGKPKECFIATAVFGEESFEVMFFRTWRDRVLKRNLPGRVLIRLYYFLSPNIAEFLKVNAPLKNLMKRFLMVLISIIARKSRENV